MSDDLVKRLRDSCHCSIEILPCCAENECRAAFEAADRIEALGAELAEARRHLDNMLGWADDLSLQCAESRPKFREYYNAAAGFLDGDDDNG